MRFFETILLAALILIYCLLFSKVRSMAWFPWVGLLPVAVLVLHFATEGPRWQMVPAYITSLLFIILCITILVFPAPSLYFQANFTTVATLTAAVVLLLSAITLPVCIAIFVLPTPTGKYAIGTTTYHWTDATRPELFSSFPDTKREIIAQVWYPAEPTTNPKAPYVENSDTLAPAMAKLFHFPTFVFNHFKYVSSHAVSSAAVAKDQHTYPVLLFIGGLDGYRQMNTFQVEELASHGYIVVGLDLPGVTAAVKLSNGQIIEGRPGEEIVPLIRQTAEPHTPAPTLNDMPFPDGLVPYLAQDVSFAIDQLQNLATSDPYHILSNRLDLSQLGIFGISMGGITAAQACYDDKRLKACLIMDVYTPAVVAQNGLGQPTMFLTRNPEDMRLERQRAGGWPDEDIDLTFTSMHATFNRLKSSGYWVTIPGMFHLNFTDVPAWSPLTTSLGMRGPLDAARGFEIINTYSVAFFDKELQHKKNTLLDNNHHPYPEVIFQSKGL